MKIPIKSTFYDNDKCVEEVNTIGIKTNDKIIYSINSKQNILQFSKNNPIFIRIIDDGKLVIDINNNKALIELNSNMLFELPVEFINYECNDTKVIIEYKLETEENNKKLIIEIE